MRKSSEKLSNEELYCSLIYLYVGEKSYRETPPLKSIVCNGESGQAYYFISLYEKRIKFKN
jgi:hypothetical protein